MFSEFHEVENVIMKIYVGLELSANKTTEKSFIYPSPSLIFV